MSIRTTAIKDRLDHANSLLVTGSYKAAAVSFSSVVQLLRFEISPAQEGGDSNDNEDELEMCFYKSSRSLLMENLCDHNDFFVFDKAAIVMGIDDTLLTSSMKQSQVAASVLYNMALSHHLWALQTIKNQSKLLGKSLKLYEMALAATNCFEHTGHGIFLSMAINNNMGNIYSHFMDVEGTQECHAALRYNIQLSDGCPSGFQDDIAHFADNTILDPQILNAPAA